MAEQVSMRFHDISRPVEENTAKWRPTEESQDETNDGEYEVLFKANHSPS